MDATPYLTIYAGDPKRGGLEVIKGLGGERRSVASGWGCSIVGGRLTFTNADKVQLIQPSLGTIAVTHIAVVSANGDVIASHPIGVVAVVEGEEVYIKPGFLKFSLAFEGE